MAWTPLRFSALSGRTHGLLMTLLVMAPLVVANPVQAQVERQLHAVTWSRTYQPIVGTDAFTVTSDGGFIIGGQGFGHGLDAWVMKADSNGEPEWEKNYHPTGYPYSTGVVQVMETRGGGYLVVGHVLFGGPWLLKLNHKGDIQWSRVYRADSFSHVEQTLDGGYIAVGNFGTIGAHDSNAWVLKLDPEGNITWQETFEGQDINSVDETRDGGFVAAGIVDVENKAEAWVLKLDALGKVIWQNALRLNANSQAYSVRQTRDGDYTVAGHSVLGALIFALNKEGNILWEESFSGSGFTASSIRETSDGGSIVVGSSTGPFLLRLDSQGNLIWLRTYGTSGLLEEAQESKHGQIIAAGSLATYCCGYVAWVLRLDSSGTVESCELGDLSNSTLTDISSELTNTAIASVNTSAIVTLAGVNIATPQTIIQTLCAPGRDERGRKA